MTKVKSNASTPSTTLSDRLSDRETKPLTIAQQAGYARRKLKNRGIDMLTDHRGKPVPIEYVPDIDLLKHFEALDIIERAEKLAAELASFKYEVQQKGDDLYGQLMDENEIRNQSVGGFTLATFDKELKVIFAMDSKQVKVPEELTLADEWWRKFLEDEFDEETEAKIGWMLEIVDELLHNTKGQIDTRNIGRLNRMAGKVKNKKYHKFVEHLNKAYDTQHTKRYEQFKRRNGQGEYDSLVLTYSSIDPVNGES